MTRITAVRGADPKARGPVLLEVTQTISQPLDGVGLRVCTLAVCIELRLQRFLVLFTIRPVARALGTEGYGRAGGTACFDGNVREPFGNAYRRFLHVTGVPTRLREEYQKSERASTDGRVKLTPLQRQIRKELNAGLQGAIVL
jgi:hypothetical protein